MSDKEKDNNKYQLLINDVKEYVSLQTNLLQVTMIEKMTKLLAKLVILALTFVLLVLFMFYLLGALAFLLEPILGFAASFAIISSLFLIVLAVVLIFRKKLIIMPLMHMLIDVFKDNDLNDKITGEGDSKNNS